MSYSPSEHVQDCKDAVIAAQLVAKHYPEARHREVCGRTVWCHEDAVSHMTGLDVDVTDKGAERWDRYGVDFVPYHEIQEGKVRVRVYAPGGFRGRMSSHEFMRRLQENAALREMVLDLFRRNT